LTYDKLMTSLGETYENLMKFIRFFVNRTPDLVTYELDSDVEDNLDAGTPGDHYICKFGLVTVNV